jgi:hypothetical protein
MRFTPRSEVEVSKLFQKGVYKFKVESAEEGNSKSGNPRLHLKLKFMHGEIVGKTNLVDCYLLTDNPNFEFLLRHFCLGVGLEDAYNKGELEPKMCVGKQGWARLGVEVDKEGTYPDKNRVLDFIFDDKDKKCVSQTENEITDDEIPF